MAALRNRQRPALYDSRMYVIGTAGHVDHGKSTLIRSLSGIDPDRLHEEKERGMTIELGFAWLGLPSGLEVSIVDVPGHERFIKNMLMGAGGVDLAMLIVAADEGVMPQTREHLAILDLLRIERGIAVITKVDLVEEEWLELVVADVEEALESYSLAGSKVVAVSAEKDIGLDQLIHDLDEELANVPPRPDLGRPRLPVDRSFTMSGFGAVVTGTLSGGILRTGQQVNLVPSGRQARIRGLQSHKEAVEEAMPGSRVAVNLSGIERHEIERGDVLVTGRWLKSSTAFDCSIRTINDSPRPIRHNHRVTLYTGTSETPAVVRLLDQNALPPGESGWAQIRLDTPVPVVKGDYFVIRDTVTTLGGGQALAPNAPRPRRFHEPTAQRLASLESGAESEILIAALDSLGPAAVAELAPAANLSEARTAAILDELLNRNEVVAIGEKSALEYFSATGWAKVVATASNDLAEYHRTYPLREGMPREELRNRLNMNAAEFNPALARLVADRVLSEGQVSVRLPAHSAKLSPTQQRRADEYLALLASNLYSPPSDATIDQELLQALAAQGRVVRVSEDVVFLKSAYEEMAEKVVQLAKQHGEVTISHVREAFSTSRKYTLALLEHMDRQQITRRSGDNRVLR